MLEQSRDLRALAATATAQDAKELAQSLTEIADRLEQSVGEAGQFFCGRPLENGSSY